MDCTDDPVYRVTLQSLNNSNWGDVFLDHTSLSKSTRETQFMVNKEPRKVVDQGNGGTCWVHATLSTYRDMFLSKHKKLTPDYTRFSVSYLLFYHLYESCHSFLDRMVKFKDLPMNDPKLCWSMNNILSEGASKNTGYILTKRYGIVPYDVMGSNEQTLDPEGLVSFLREILVKATYKIRKGESDVIKKVMPIVHKYLCVSLGTPPDKFEYEFRGKPSIIVKDISPIEFYNKYIQKHDEGTVYMSSYSDTKDGTWYSYKDCDTVTGIKKEDKAVYNTSPEDLMSHVVNTLRHNHIVYAGVDIGNDYSEEYGWADKNLYYPEVILSDTEKEVIDVERNDIRNIRGIYPNHAIIIVGYRTENGKKNSTVEHFLIENSWGDDSGRDGHLRVSREWFIENVLEASIPAHLVAKEMRTPTKIIEKECYENIGNLL